jgi:hypothetical protein
VQKFLVYPEFKKFVADTAIDGIGQVLIADKEKISHDYKVMKQMVCKGDIPSLMTIKIKTDNPLIDNLDLDNVETRLQKEIEKQKREQMSKEQREAEDRKKEQEAKAREQGEVVEEEEDVV